MTSVATIIADASYCPDTKVAGYAFWISSNRKRVGGDGVLRGPQESSLISEMKALMNGLKAALQEEIIMENEGALLQTDCQGAIDAFMYKRRKLSKEEVEVVSWFKRTVTRLNLKIEFKHVKGHSNRQENRFVANKICDRRAFAHMKAARYSAKLDAIKESLDG